MNDQSVYMCWTNGGRKFFVVASSFREADRLCPPDTSIKRVGPVWPEFEQGQYVLNKGDKSENP